MSKQRKYLQIKGIRARNEAIYAGLMSCHQALENIREYALPLMKDGEAKEVQAMHGEESL